MIRSLTPRDIVGGRSVVRRQLRPVLAEFLAVRRPLRRRGRPVRTEICLGNVRSGHEIFWPPSLLSRRA
jgi:hypothetical protein